MASVCIPEISAALARRVAEPGRASYCLAFSGGLDSTALLYAMTRLRVTEPAMQLRALHVNHHLLPQADAWAEHCRQMAAKLDVPIEVLEVEVAQGPGVSVEAAARDARYAALEAHLLSDEWLLTAHHQEDQLETVLLQLMRGAGVAGLSAMPEDAPFGKGHHVRPLLGLSRAALEAMVREAGLTWVEDASNQSLQYDRNYLRHRVLPLLIQRWPNAAATVTRTAGHMAEAQGLLDDLARIDMANAADADSIGVAALQALPLPRARNLLRFWIRQRGFRPPSTVKLQEILRQMLESRPDASPRVVWDSVEIARRGRRLYLEAIQK